MMKQNMIHYLSVFTILSAMMLLGACSDWTEPESLQLNYSDGTLEEKDPALYAAYLSDLNRYKTSNHKCVFISFNNPESEPIHQVERLTALPDSIDFVSLLHPDNLPTKTQEEMGQIRQKGTKVIYNIDYDVFAADWDALVKASGTNGTANEDDFSEEASLAYIAHRTTEALALCDKFGYDGLIASFRGEALISLSPEKLSAYSLRQKTFIELVDRWKDAHPTKILAFQGNVAYLTAEGEDNVLPIYDNRSILKNATMYYC